MTADQLAKELESIKAIPKIAEEFMKLPHYKKMGFEKLCIIIEAARNMGIPSQRALSGGMYAVRDGKLEVGYRLLNEIIISRGHQIKVLKDTPEVCELEGIRKDSKCSQKSSFSMEDANRAKLIRPGPWTQYPQDMLYARALSRLARRLFPDVITSNTYVEGEIDTKPSAIDRMDELKPSQEKEVYDEVARENEE